MPIFISPFSPERSLVGNFLSTRSQKNSGDSEPASAQKRQANTPKTEAARGLDQPQDRLDLSQPQTASAPEETRTGNPTGTDSTSRVPGTETSRTTQTSENSTPAQQTRTAEAGNTSARASEPKEKSSNPLFLRLDQNLSSNASGRTTSGISSAGNFLASLQQENRDAARSAISTRLDALVSRLEQNRQAEETRAEEEIQIQATEPETAAPETATREASEPKTSPQQVQQTIEPLPREIQEQELQRNLQSISSGLQADAATESRRTAEAIGQKTQQATAQNQTEQIQENRTEVQSLQGERRQLQQDIQEKDQAIRQIQNQIARLQSSGSQTRNSGSQLDILAQ